MISYSTLTLLLPGAILLHVTEEFLYPGGFIEWYRALRPPLREGIKPGYLVWINTLMMGVCVGPAYLGHSRPGASLWYGVAAIGAINAGFHIWGVIRLKTYSPGVVTGVLLYLPLWGYGSWYLRTAGELSWAKMLMYVGIGVVYHFISLIRQGH